MTIGVDVPGDVIPIIDGCSWIVAAFEQFAGAGVIPATPRARTVEILHPGLEVEIPVW